MNLGCLTQWIQVEHWFIESSVGLIFVTTLLPIKPPKLIQLYV